MTQENKELLLRDLCGRLPYMVKCCIKDNYKISGDLVGIVGENISLFSSGCGTFNISVVKPYLFPMSSMTDEQLSKYHNNCDIGLTEWGNELYYDCAESFDWLNAHHFDYRGLIDKGLAIDATGLNIY